jgi:hypothetical protein
MILTTGDLSKSKYGISYGIENSKIKEKCFSQKYVINFINEYFGGEIEADLDDDNNIVSGRVKYGNLNTDSKTTGKYIRLVSKPYGLTTKEYLMDIMLLFDSNIKDIKVYKYIIH